LGGFLGHLLWKQRQGEASAQLLEEFFGSEKTVPFPKRRPENIFSKKNNGKGETSIYTNIT